MSKSSNRCSNTIDFVTLIGKERQLTSLMNKQKNRKFYSVSFIQSWPPHPHKARFKSLT